MSNGLNWTKVVIGFYRATGVDSTVYEIFGGAGRSRYGSWTAVITKADGTKIYPGSTDTLKLAKLHAEVRNDRAAEKLAV